MPRPARGRRASTRRGRASSDSSSDGTQTATGYALLLFAAVDGALELLLRHPRPTLDAHPLRLVVELLLRAPLRPLRAGAKPPATARGDVGARQPGRGLRLT